jgi:hypothetical protein
LSASNEQLKKLSKDDQIRFRRKHEFSAFKVQREKNREEAEANAKK